MDTYIIAQLIGLIGYLFYISAPHLKTQKQIIQMDVLACIILCLQWHLLNQPTLLVLNALIILTSIISLGVPRNQRLKTLSFLLYPIGCISLISVSQGNIVDILAITAFCLTVTSKLSQDIIGFRTYAAIAGIAFMLSGSIALSIPAIIFNALFTYTHTKKLWQNMIQRNMNTLCE